MPMFSQIKDLAADSKEYVESKLELHKLKLVDKTARTISFSTTLVVVSMAGLFCLGFASVGLALKLGDWMGKVYYGVFIVGGFYLIIFLIVYGMRNKWIKRPVTDLIIQHMLK
jgi:Putative Actinobacterial Holin-X, holin superfamily III